MNNSTRITYFDEVHRRTNIHMAISIGCWSRVARFFVTQYTKTEKNIPNYLKITQMAIKNTKWTSIFQMNIKNFDIYVLFQGTKKFTKSGFGLEKNIWQPCAGPELFWRDDNWGLFHGLLNRLIHPQRWRKQNRLLHKLSRRGLKFAALKLGTWIPLNIFSRIKFPPFLGSILWWQFSANFADFRRKELAFFSKNNVMIKFLQNLADKIFDNFFSENTF
jgi:hypothetical protein